MSELTDSRAELETALQRYVRASRDDTEGVLYIQDWVIACASESMEPGQENVTYFNHINRLGLPVYTAVGLLDNCMNYYRVAGKPID